MEPDTYIQFPAGPAGPRAPFNANDADSTVVVNDPVSAYAADDADTEIPGIEPDPCG